MKKLIALTVLTVLCATPRASHAISSYKTAFNNRYATAGSRLDSCLVCHDTSPAGASWNSYGNYLADRMLNFGDSLTTALASAEPLDSDGDGYSNLAEIQARTFPGDPNDHPITSAPSIGVSPATLPFGNVRLGTATALAVTVTNTGNAALSLTTLGVTGTAEFGLSNAPALPLSVPAGGSTKLNIRYAPANTGPDTGSLAIGSNDSAHPTVTVALSGTGVAPALTVNPTTLAFGSLIQGQTANLTVTLGNTGSATCNVTGLNKSGSTDFSFGSGAPVPPFAITPGSTILVPLAYTPSNVGADSGSLQIVSDDPVNPSVNVTLSGTGNPVPAVINITLTPATLAFGAVRVGQTATLSASIGNTGGATGTVTALGVTGADFAPTGPATPFTVAPGASISVPVTYTPSAVGNGIGTLALTSNDPNHPTLNVSLTGNGVAPHIGVTPLAADFGTLTIGGNATRSISITNSGGAALAITSLVLTASAEYNYVAGTPVPPFSLAAGRGTNVTLRYTPVDVGVDTGSLVIGSDDPNAPQVSVSLTGAGQAPVALPSVSVTPLALGFGDIRTGSSSTLKVTVNNTGGAVAHLGAPSVAGSADFATSATAFDVAAGGAVDVFVQYAPSGVGADSGTLTFTSNDPSNATINVSLTGRGVQSALSVTPATVSFGSVVTNGTVTRLVTIVNSGSASAQVSGLTLSGTAEFSLGAATPALPFTVAAGANMDVSLSYKPTNVGSDSGSLDIASDDPSHPHLAVALSGSGVSAGTAVDFDIGSFSVTPQFQIGRDNAVQIRLTVINRSKTSATRTTTVVGVQNNAEVYRASLPVSPKARGGVQLAYPNYIPQVAGTIQWTATVEDDDPDADVSTATTRVLARPSESEQESEHETSDSTGSGSSDSGSRERRRGNNGSRH